MMFLRQDADRSRLIVRQSELNLPNNLLSRLPARVLDVDGVDVGIARAGTVQRARHGEDMLDVSGIKSKKTKARDAVPALFAVVLALGLCLIPPAAGAEDSPLKPLAETAASFFRPLSADVLSAGEGVVEISAGADDGVLKGMRLRIFRKGGLFRHPVTGEVIGRIENPVGLAEVVEVDDGRVLCTMVEGEATAGDVARISSSRKKMLFYPLDSVDYYLGDAFYRELRGTGRFEIVDAPPDMEDEGVFDVALSEGVDVVLRLSADAREDGTYLVQRLLWPDGTLLSEATLRLPDDFMAGLRFGSDLLGDVGNDPLLVYDLPFGAELLSSGDVDGDGRTDLVLTSGSDLFVYSFDVDLGSLYRLEGDSAERIIWIDMFDVDNDGRDEIFLTTLSSDGEEVKSYVYGRKEGEFTVLWTTEGFIRIVGKEILWQGYSDSEGYSGPIRHVLWRDGLHKGGVYGGAGDLDIHDFAVLKEMGGARIYLTVDKDNRLCLVDAEGLPSWCSGEGMGGFPREYKAGDPLKIAAATLWHVTDRMVRVDDRVLVIKRKPLVGKKGNFGYKSSQLWAYRYDGRLDGSVLLSVRGNVLDYSVLGDKVALLVKPLFRFRAGNILRGRTPLVTTLQIYSIKGR